MGAATHPRRTSATSSDLWGLLSKPVELLFHHAVWQHLRGLAFQGRRHRQSWPSRARRPRPKASAGEEPWWASRRRGDGHTIRDGARCASSTRGACGARNPGDSREARPRAASASPCRPGGSCGSCCSRRPAGYGPTCRCAGTPDAHRPWAPHEDDGVRREGIRHVHRRREQGPEHGGARLQRRCSLGCAGRRWGSKPALLRRGPRAGAGRWHVPPCGRHRNGTPGCGRSQRRIRSLSHAQQPFRAVEPEGMT